MSRLSVKLSVLLMSLISAFAVANVYADDVVSTTTVNPATQESTTTTVNPATQQTTVVKTNPMTNQTTTTIITPTPEPQDAVQPPQGYIKCFNVDAGWYKDVWVPKHNVCQYDSTAAGNQGAAWIAGHWICTKYTVADQACTKWEWKAGHWVKTIDEN